MPLAQDFFGKSSIREFASNRRLPLQSLDLHVCVKHWQPSLHIPSRIIRYLPNVTHSLNRERVRRVDLLCHDGLALRIVLSEERDVVLNCIMAVVQNHKNHAEFIGRLLILPVRLPSKIQQSMSEFVVNNPINGARLDKTP